MTPPCRNLPAFRPRKIREMRPLEGPDSASTVPVGVPRDSKPRETPCKTWEQGNRGWEERRIGDSNSDFLECKYPILPRNYAVFGRPKSWHTSIPLPLNARRVALNCATTVPRAVWGEPREHGWLGSDSSLHWWAVQRSSNSAILVAGSASPRRLSSTATSPQLSG